MDEAARRGIPIRYAARVTSARTVADRGVVTLDDGTELSADLVVAADGIHSVARRQLDPSAPAPRYVGLTNFGGITRNSPSAARLTPEAWTFVFGRRAFFGAFPEPDGSVVWFVNAPRPEISREERASTTDAEWKEWLESLMAHDRSEAATLIATGELQLAGDNTYDLAHVPVWHDDHVVLVGDAAHAPSPSAGQGASMALEDAVALAAAVRETTSVAEALSRYESRRRARVERIVAVGARSSSAKIPGRVGRVFQEAVMRLVFRAVVTDRRQEWMTGHRSETLVTRSVDARQ
jgi:2-polyprenyl-6-methoxyphenol hydroxylase-like FAD-dependent oxidoreductase